MTDSNAKINMLIRASCPGTDTPAHELHRATLLLEYLRDEIASLRTRERAAERAVKQAQLAVDRGKEAETLASLFRDFKKEVLPRCIRGEGTARIEPENCIGVLEIRGDKKLLKVHTVAAKNIYAKYRRFPEYNRSTNVKIKKVQFHCAIFIF